MEEIAWALWRLPPSELVEGGMFCWHSTTAFEFINHQNCSI